MQEESGQATIEKNDKYTEKANRYSDLEKKKIRCVTVSSVMSVIAVWLLFWTVLAIVFDITSEFESD